MSNEVNFPLSDEEYQKRNKELSELVSKAYAALEEATEFANKYHLSFSWSPGYGMGGRYYGDPEDQDDYMDGGWYSSSQSC